MATWLYTMALQDAPSGSPFGSLDPSYAVSPFDSFIKFVAIVAFVGLVVLLVLCVITLVRLPKHVDDLYAARVRWRFYPVCLARWSVLVSLAFLLDAAMKAFDTYAANVDYGGAMDPGRIAVGVCDACRFTAFGFIILAAGLLVAWVFDTVVDRRLLARCGK